MSSYRVISFQYYYHIVQYIIVFRRKERACQAIQKTNTQIGANVKEVRVVTAMTKGHNDTGTQGSEGGHA